MGISRVRRSAFQGLLYGLVPKGESRDMDAGGAIKRAERENHD